MSQKESTNPLSEMVVRDVLWGLVREMLVLNDPGVDTSCYGNGYHYKPGE